ncbi:hypothetical protein TNCV_4520421 [Trichonephila clavipes]|nr:hypothetical protein TNCV_4520421 [Trichonephila clavipes]
MEALSGQSFVPTNSGRVDEEMIPTAHRVSQAESSLPSPGNEPLTCVVIGEENWRQSRCGSVRIDSRFYEGLGPCCVLDGYAK